MRLVPVLLSAVLAFHAPARAQEVAPFAALEPAALGCMTSAIYHEAAREPDEGQRAVARVVLNRVASPAYPKSVCAVVFQGSSRTTGCQFSFTCDGALGRRVDPALWAHAADTAGQALANPDALPDLAALHYHADYVHPRWASGFAEERRIGRHIFYAGKPAAIARRATPQDGPRPATFAVWGLGVARVSPTATGISVAELPRDPAPADEPL